MVGMPLVLSTFTASLNVTVTSTVSPSLHCPSDPAPLAVGVSSMVGGSPSTCPEPAGPSSLTGTCCRCPHRGRPELVQL